MQIFCQDKQSISKSLRLWKWLDQKNFYFVTYLKKTSFDASQESRYTSDLFSMVGTIFLWMYWPSFNAATALAGPAQHRAILNTYYSLAACVLATFSISALLNPHKKFVMVMILNKKRIFCRYFLFFGWQHLAQLNQNLATSTEVFIWIMQQRFIVIFSETEQMLTFYTMNQMLAKLVEEIEPRV